MTERTINVYCETCHKYLFSIQPNDSIKLFAKHYCTEECEVIGKLKDAKTYGAG